MKLVSFLARATVVTGAAFLLGLAFDQHALAFFGLAISSSFLLVMARDYVRVGANTARLQLKPSPVGAHGRKRAKYTMPFAA